MWTFLLHGHGCPYDLMRGGEPHTHSPSWEAEHVPLNFLNSVRVITNDLGESDFPDFLQLLLGKGPSLISMLMIETIPEFGSHELVPKNTSECRTDNSLSKREFRNSRGEQVNVSDFGVNL